MKLLVTGAWRCTQDQLNELENLGHKVIFMQNEKDDVPCPCDEVEGVICNGLFLYHPIEKFKSLHYIQLTSAGFDRVPMDFVKSRDIRIYNARGVYSIPMAEFALSGVLQMFKQTRFFYENQRKKEWVKNRNMSEIYGKTVCIVGCGNVGTECAKRFSAFGCNVIGVDLVPFDNALYEKVYSLSELDGCLAKSDIVLLTLPLTDDTRHMMNSERFSVMKPGAILVNIARGAIIEDSALLTALDEKLSGAVLDVFESEPLSPDSPLWDKENVIITPHNSFVGDGNTERLREVILNNLKELL